MGGVGAVFTSFLSRTRATYGCVCVCASSEQKKTQDECPPPGSVHFTMTHTAGGEQN